MYYELSNPPKEIARKVMDKGLEQHYNLGLIEVEKIINKCKSGKVGPQDSYKDLFDKLGFLDKKIARIYKNKGGSRYVEVMAMQYADGVIQDSDLDEFEEEVKLRIVSWSQFFEKKR